MSRSFESTSFTVRPSIAIVPAVISSNPASIRSSVDLPQPDGPTSTMNSPSWMSNEMPWMTFVLPKAFSMFWNDTEAIFTSRLHRACGQARLHVPLEHVVDRRRRQRVDQSGRHQELPGRVVSGEELPERNGERHVLVPR